MISINLASNEFTVTEYENDIVISLNSDNLIKIKQFISICEPFFKTIRSIRLLKHLVWDIKKLQKDIE